MRALLLAGAALIAAPLSAQDHASHSSDPQPELDHCAMGHVPPEQCPPKNEPIGHDGMDHGVRDHSGHDDSGRSEQPDHSAMDHSSMDHSDHGPAKGKSASGAAPQSAVPARAFEAPRHAADAIWGEQAMAPSRANLARENGGMRTGSVMVERLEARIATDDGEDGYVWDAQAFYGGDINRFVIKSEGEGEFGGTLEDAEIQALYSRAIAPFFDLQAGVRQDLTGPKRTHAVIGVQGLMPYMFEIDAAAFLSDKGDLTARIEAEYDQRLSQRLILQPRAEVNLSAQEVPELDIGSGIDNIELGLRLRYEIVPEFAPYVGIEQEWKLGGSRDFARLAGEDPSVTNYVIGVRFWF